MTKKRVVKYFSAFETLEGKVSDAILKLQAIADEYPDAEITVYGGQEPEIEAWREETDEEYNTRRDKEAEKERKERQKRLAQYEELKKEFEGTYA